MRIHHRPSVKFGAVVAAFATVTLASTISLWAHRVTGRTYSTLATALVQSPTASPVDLPLPIFDTGLSVICIKVTNTSPIDTRITAIGLELPGALSGFSLVTPVNADFGVQENVGPIPGFPGVTLDLALVVSQDGGGVMPRGIPPGATPLTICITGPFPTGTPIETLLNGVFVRFDTGGAFGNRSDIGVWERRPG
ncbi:MAG: hypothetical protein ABR606_08220 [Vicinamibacterales bacterium]